MESALAIIFFATSLVGVLKSGVKMNRKVEIVYDKAGAKQKEIVY